MDVQDTLRELVDGQHELFIAITDVARRQDRMENQMSDLAITVKDLKDYTYAGFDTMNDRFDRLEDRVDHLEASLSRLG